MTFAHLPNDREGISDGLLMSRENLLALTIEKSHHGIINPLMQVLIVTLDK